MDKLNGGTVQQSVSDFDGFRVVASTVEICYDCIENIRRGDKRRKRGLQTALMLQRGTMILVIR